METVTIPKGEYDRLKHSEKVAEKLWGNEEDDIWDSV